jgi:hypothetical protein
MGARGRGQPVLLGGDQQAAEQEQRRLREGRIESAFDVPDKRSLVADDH